MVLTNVLGPALLIKAALPALKATRGRIVLVGSVAGHIHTPGNLYGATKWAVTGLAENTRLRVTADGIGVTLISPGPVETHFSDPAGGLPPDRTRMTADQLAACIVWAITPAGRCRHQHHGRQANRLSQMTQLKTATTVEEKWTPYPAAGRPAWRGAPRALPGRAWAARIRQ